MNKTDVVLVHSFPAHMGGTTSVSFSPDGWTLATGGYDCTIRLWDVRTWQDVQVLPGHRRGHAAFSPNGRLLLSGGLHSDATVYTTTDWRVVQTLQGSDGVWAATFRRDGSEAILIRSEDRSEERSHRPVEFWDMQDWKQTGTADVGTDHIYSVAFAPDDKTAALAHPPDGSVSIWNSDFRQKLTEFSAHRHATWGAAFSPEGALLATVGADDAIRLWDTSSWQMRHEWQHTQAIDGAHLEQGILCVAFSPDGKLLVTGCLNGMLSVWGTESLF